MMRAVCLFLLLTFVAATIGCQQDIDAGVDLENATTVTIDQFRDVAKEDDSFWWVGSKEGFHYFRLRDGFYRVAASEVEMPGFQVFIDRGQGEPHGSSYPARLHPELDAIGTAKEAPDF